MNLPKCLLITPARNEAANIEKTIHSMVAQTNPPARWVIVNDGSTDDTPRIVDRYAASYPWIERLDMPAHRDRSFAAKAHCFNTACGKEGLAGFDVVGNIDADISFEPDLLTFLLLRFAENPKLGVAGTPFIEADGYDSTSDSFEGENHVAGQFQLFRRTCLEDIGGYVPNKAGGVDWIAVTTARMKGWETRSFREKRFFHHRTLGTAERGRLAALYSYGEKDYYLGGSPVWEVSRVAYRMTKSPRIFGGLALGAGYLTAAIRRIPRPVSTELMRFHRHEQMKKLKVIVGSLLRLRKVDNFTVLSSQTSESKEGGIR